MLIEANKAGTLKHDYGGYALYLKQRDEKRRELDEKIKQYDPLANKKSKK
jgi:hypothetical protein